MTLRRVALLGVDRHGSRAARVLRAMLPERGFQLTHAVFADTSSGSYVHRDVRNVTIDRLESLSEDPSVDVLLVNASWVNVNVIRRALHHGKSVLYQLLPSTELAALKALRDSRRFHEKLRLSGSRPLHEADAVFRRHRTALGNVRTVRMEYQYRVTEDFRRTNRLDGPFGFDSIARMFLAQSVYHLDHLLGRNPLAVVQFEKFTASNTSLLDLHLLYPNNAPVHLRVTVGDDLEDTCTVLAVGDSGKLWLDYNQARRSACVSLELGEELENRTTSLIDLPLSVAAALTGLECLRFDAAPEDEQAETSVAKTIRALRESWRTGSCVHLAEVSTAATEFASRSEKKFF